MIDLKDVHKIYRTGQTSVHALRGINFSVNEGDFCVVHGPSGSGKSTLLNILGLLDDPTKGEVFLRNEKVSYADFDKLASLRSQFLSFIFQSFNLNPVLSVAENVMVPLMIRQDIPLHEKQDRVEKWVANVGLNSHASHYPEQLSGGQQQRVAIARAMVSHPRVIIADEPTANLDSKTAVSILTMMQELNRNDGVAFVFATHDPIIDNFAKSVVTISDGMLYQDRKEPHGKA